MPIVYLVATGETFGSAETYTRHETLPALCDAEVLHTGADDTLCDELRQEGYAEGRYDERELLSEPISAAAVYSIKKASDADGLDVVGFAWRLQRAMLAGKEAA